MEPCGACGASPLLHARYQLQAPIGGGEGAGSVFRAHDTETDRTVAIKEQVFASSRSLKAWELFDREWQVLKSLRHPRIPSYVEHFRQGEGRRLALYTVVDFVEGSTLRQEMQQARSTAQEVLATVIELLEIVDYLHQLAPPILHRDLKLDNVMRASDGKLTLIDFGAVREGISSATSSTVVGTYGYMAPEQFHGGASRATDVYGVGAVLVALLSRKDPAQLEGTDGLAWQGHISASKDLSAIISDLLHKDPALRPSARAAIEALGASPEASGRAAAAPASLCKPALKLSSPGLDSASKALVAPVKTIALAPAVNRGLQTTKPAAGSSKLTHAQRAYAEQMGAEIATSYIRGETPEARLLHVMSDHSIAVELRPEILRLARQSYALKCKAENRRQLPMVSGLVVAAGLVFPLLTYFLFGARSISYFGWAFGLVPLGVIGLVFSTASSARPDSTTKKRGPSR